MSALSRRLSRIAFPLLAALWSLPGAAADFSLSGLLSRNLDHWLITVAFALCLLAALIVARLAAARARDDANSGCAVFSVSGFQGGLALSGDSLSGASFLGVSAMIVAYGYDSLIYVVGFLAGWPLMTLFLTERLRNIGKFTMGDALAYRLNTPSIRVFSATVTLIVILFCLAAQMVGVGQLIKLLFGLEYWMGVVIVGAMMMLYVRKSGFLAAAWLSIVKAALLLAGTAALAFLVLRKTGFSLTALTTPPSGFFSVGGAKAGLHASGTLLSDPVSVISVSLALICGLVVLPQVSTRFFIAPDPIEARKSAFRATVLNGSFYLLILIIGCGAAHCLPDDPVFPALWRDSQGGDNMAVLYLAHTVGGPTFTGVIAAIAFLTILSVMGALALSAAAAASHDLYAIVHKKGRTRPEQERKAARAAVLGLTLLAVLMGVAAKQANIALLVAAAFSVAASAIFPVLLASVFWRRCTTRGALIGGYAGLISAILLMALSEPVWVGLLDFQDALFPYASPALFSMSLAFLGVFCFSITDKSPRGASEQARFEALKIRAETGIGGLS